MNERQQKSGSSEPGEVKQPPRPDIEPGVNEALADQIQRGFQFRLQRAPENIVTKVGLVKIILILLQVLLLIHNKYGALGYWPFFLDLSVHFREALKGTHLAHVAGLDSSSLDAYSLWRGVVVPGFLSVTTYIVVSLLSLRHELYHWKPHLLQEYLESAKDSFVGRFLPGSWLDYAFHIYETKHRNYISHKLQKPSYRALDDAKQFTRILKTVGFNMLISLGVLLGLWMLLLQTKLDTYDALVLPRSYVPPVQFTAWYACNDFFYFYPHWIAHTKKPRKGIHYKFLPAPIADAIQKSLQGVHKAHHKSKAQLGVAAWYCSPWEQIFLNLVPAFIGPLLTQLLSEAVGVDHIWGTHLLILYIWFIAATAISVLSHTGYRSRWNDPGKHDLHHERAFDPNNAVNFGTMGLFDWLHGTASSIPEADALAWRAQRDRQAALVAASRRTGIALTSEQNEVVKQPDHSGEWLDKRADE